MIDNALTEKLTDLEAKDGIPLADVTVIVSNSSIKRSPDDSRIKDFFRRRHPNVRVKVNFEMEGLEAPVVILIRNGGHLGSSISLGISRATTRLVIITPEESNIMDKAVREGRVKKVDIVKDPRSIYDHVKIPEDTDKARWSCVGSALHSLHKSIPDYAQKQLKCFLNIQTR